MTRKVVYLTGTRADYGLMRRSLKRIAQRPDLSLQLIVTGMHLLLDHGHTVDEIEADGFSIAARLPTELGGNSGAFMAKAVGTTTIGVTEALVDIKPDIMLLLGDRGEMLAGAIAALHLNVPIAHIHGGERSGTVDEPVRHAISKLSHFHFVATKAAERRLIAMGEAPSSVYVVGAPGLDGLDNDATIPSKECRTQFGFNQSQPIALLVFHPVVQQAAAGADHVRAILSALQIKGVQCVAVQPNSDAGSDSVRMVLSCESASPSTQIVTHLHRHRFVSWMRAADFMIGNSSAGIIEAASFGTPVINVGNRQNLRERNANVIDVAPNVEMIVAAIDAAMRVGRYPGVNIYGDGNAAQRIADLLATIDISPAILEKCCAY
jgi:GDP/UDP-N,N'-diacetylbacillosamine 2-epimerase (hydrolysing)